MLRNWANSKIYCIFVNTRHRDTVSNTTCRKFSIIQHVISLMRQFLLRPLILLILVTTAIEADAQLIKKAENIIKTAFSDSDKGTPDSVDLSSLSIEERYRRDSVRLSEMAGRLEELQSTELQLRTELALARNENQAADSVKLARQIMRIDSLRSVTPGVPVVIEGDTLFTLYAPLGGYSAAARAEMIRENVVKIGKDRRLRTDTIHILENDGYVDLIYGDKVVMSVTDMDALWQGSTKEALAGIYAPMITGKIHQLKKDYNLLTILLRIALSMLVVTAQYLLFKLTNYLFRRLRRVIIRFKQQKLRPLIIRDYELLNKRRLGHILILLSNILRYIVLLIELTFTVPLLFVIFPQTEKLALRIFTYIIDPVKMVLRAIVDYIPNLFIIAVIWFSIRYLIKGVRFIANEIGNDKLKINGFYSDWAQPTFNIIRFLLYAFMIAMIYPYLPGADSGVFQGISVFVGLIVSLGSSTVIGNIIAGLVITYMRPFKIGDRIKLNDTTGNVIEKTPFVTRLRTPKNEVVTIPNSFIMSSHTVNYSSSARQFGLIIHTTVTIGYDVPWRLVHQLLINAARITPGVEEHPKPFVLETELQDYYPCYQINAYITDANKQPRIMSALCQNIQDTFNEAGVEIMSPQYIATRDGNASTIPTEQ